MKGAPRAVALGLVLLSAGAVHAQAWYEQPAEREEARRTIAEVKRLMETTERGDPRPAAAALRDRAWIVRLLAAVRLGVLGLDPPTVAALRGEGDPTRPPPAEDFRPYVKAKEFAEALEVELGPPVQVEAREALRVAGSILTERVRSGPPTEEAGTKRRMVETLLAWRAAAAEAQDHAWLARRLLGLTDLDQALRDLGKQSADEAVGRAGDDVFRWYGENVAYLYWHPAERRFRVDVEARAAQKPSAEFRRATPWPAGQGPNAPPRETDGGR